TLWLSNPSLSCLSTLSLLWCSHQSHAGETQNRCSASTNLLDAPNLTTSDSESYSPSPDFHLHPQTCSS
ncbi:hypothetical protein ATANTOWER_014413, partial [Ataeniobius toweri]|nr:hypothetical protein [Ataeniobius toweri]